MTHRTHRFLPLVVTLIALGLLGAFVWRIVGIYSGIQRGEIKSALDLTFQDSLTTSPRLAQIVQRTDPVQAQEVVSEDDPSLGNPEALLTIVEFADFGCPYSREASFAIRALSLAYADRVRYIYRDFPITEIHPDAQMAAEAGECARVEGDDKFWAYHDTLYQNQNDLTRPALREYARAVGLNVPKFDQCLASGRYRSEVTADIQDGIDAGVIGTPTFFFNGQKVSGAIPLETLRLITDVYLE